jgi:hypothetical protein
MVLQDDTLTFYTTGVRLRLRVPTNLIVLQTPRRTKTGLILLRDVDRIARVDAKPYCLELEANGRRYLVALQSDGELYELQDEVYVRSAGGTVSRPYGFAHVGHVGWEAGGGLPQLLSLHQASGSGWILKLDSETERMVLKECRTPSLRTS